MTTDADTLAALLARRHSCRAFRPDPVPRADVEAALVVAQRVPSWCNSQPWMTHVCGPEETDRLRAALTEHISIAPHSPDIAFPEAYEGAYKERRSTCGWQLYDAVGVTKGDRAGSAAEMRKNFAFFGAPHFLLITTPKKLGAYGVLDCGAYLTALLLAFEARGIASVPQAAVAGFSPFMRDWFAIPDDRDVLVGASFGYSDRDHPANSFRTDRAPLSEVVDWR
ncbi:nitroreductase [Tropicibacter sp. S64]|uniref:nitroreductase n=1 Tax=Tropicibacter sp. S64 TaxID=3415122 RepID=UPI003C7BABD6